MHTSRFAQLAGLLAAAAALLCLGAPLAIQLGFVAPGLGFRAFLLGALLGLPALLLGLVALYTTRPATGRVGRKHAVAACVVGASILAAVGFAAGPSAGLPPINDISTDPENPPRFDALAEVGVARGDDMAYPGPSFAVQQRSGYPDLGPIEIAAAPATTTLRVRDAMEGFGWEVVDTDPEGGRVEATHTSRLFRFVDDIVVRVQPSATGSRVDVRSRSRVGRSDLGANAARIRRLRDSLR